MGRIVLLMADSARHGCLQHWYSDEHTRSLVRELLTEPEMEEFDDIAPGHAIWTRDLIEEKILVNMRRIIAGSQSVEEGMEWSREILKRTLQVMQETRRDLIVES